MHNPPLSSGVVMAPGYSITGGLHVHPKAKSNDMMMIKNQHLRGSGTSNK